jgi:hypothetical protein
MKQFLVVLTLLSFFIACKKKGEPIPRICVETKDAIDDQVTIKYDDTLALVNCSERFSNQRWVMPDGGSSTDASVYFVPPALGSYTVRLYVSNKEFLNEYEAVKQITVIP